MFNIKKMRKKAEFLESILSELHEIKCHLANDRPFEGGVGLGGIMNFLCNEREKTLNTEDEDEEVQDEESDEECEESSEEEGTCAECRESTYEQEFYLLRSEHRDLKLKYHKQHRRIMDLETVLRNLLRKDHVFKASLDEVISVVKREDETIEDVYTLLPGNHLKMETQK